MHWLVPWYSQYTAVIKGIAPGFLGHLVTDYGKAKATWGRCMDPS